MDHERCNSNLGIQESKKGFKLLTYIFVCVFVFGFAAHAYRFFNPLFSHDSMDLFANSTQWRIAIGRYLEPVYILIRGNLSAPFLIGLFAMIWVSLAAYMVVKLFDIQSGWVIALTCGILVTNSTFTLSNASYLPWLDVFMMGNLLAVLSVWIFVKYRYGFIWGALPLMLSVALYQSCVQIAVILLLIWMVMRLLAGEKAGAVVGSGIKELVMLALGMALYFAIYKLLLALFGISAANAINSTASVGNYGDTNLLKLLAYTAAYTVYSFVLPASAAQLLIGMVNMHDNAKNRAHKAAPDFGLSNKKTSELK